MPFIWMAALLLSQEPAELTKARQDLLRLKDLVVAGAVAPSRLADAIQNVADAEDSQILTLTLYGELTIEQLDQKQAAAMISSAQRRFLRQQDRLARQQKLIDAGVMAKGDAEPAEAELETRRAVVSLAKARSRLLEELIDIAQAEQTVASPESKSEAETGGPVIERFAGSGLFNDGDLKHLTLEFEKQFSKSLPVSAKGETAVHKALGFDHRGRIDLGVDPDSGEGSWLRKFLALNRIPFIAFRQAIRGQATAPHIHVGTPSPRITVAD